MEYLKRVKQAKRKDIEELLLDKLPNILDKKQKRNKIKNLLQDLRKQGVILVEDKIWRVQE